MATLYVTNNANSGSGTLREAITSASPGDVIAPDATLFPKGTPCEVALTSLLHFPEGVVVDGLQTRFALTSSASGNTSFQDGARFRNVDFIGYSSTGTGGALWIYGATEFESCGFYGCSAARGVFYIRANALLSCLNSVVAGNRGTSETSTCYLVAPTSLANFVHCTLVGNVSSTGTTWNREPTLTNCKTTTTGMIAAPSLTYEDWTSSSWKSWDLRLTRGAVDATGAPERGTVWDFYGNARRKTGASLGAYETLDADLYWVGYDANGDPCGSTGSFDLATGWASDPDATVCGETSANDVGRLFVGSNVTFDDAWTSSASGATLILGADAEVSATLGGQRVWKESRGSSISLSGNAIIQEESIDDSWTFVSPLVLSCLSCALERVSFTVPSGVSIDFAGTFAVESLNVAGELTVPDGLTLSSLAMSSGSRLVLPPGAVLLTTSVPTLSGVVESDGIAYFAAPVGTTTGTLSNVRFANIGAKVESLSASRSGTTVSLTATVGDESDASALVLYEKQTGTDEWTAVSSATSRTATTTAPEYRVNGVASFRVFDGTFTVATVAFYIPPSHTWLEYDQTHAVEIAPKWIIVTGYQMQSAYYNAGETPLFFARITNSGTGEAIKPETVESISYTCFKRTYSWGGSTLTAVEGHIAQSVPVSAVLEEVVPPTDDARWTTDSTGYNFVFEPDARERALFPEAGDYQVVFNVEFYEGNSAPIVYNVSVK